MADLDLFGHDPDRRKRVVRSDWDHFEYVWQHYPRRVGSQGIKKKAFRSYRRNIKDGDITPAGYEFALERLIRQQDEMGNLKPPTCYVPMATTWFANGCLAQIVLQADIDAEQQARLRERLQEI